MPTQTTPSSAAQPPTSRLGASLSWMITPLLLLAFWALVSLQPTPQDAAGVRWAGVQLVSLLDAMSLAPKLPQPVDVSLPHSWQPNGLPSKGIGHYALSLEVTDGIARDAMTEPWSLRIDRLSPAHRVWLNGRLISSTLPRPGWLTLAAPYLLDVPAGALLPGVNTLEIEVHCAGQCGLTPVTMARKAALQPGFAFYERITRDMLVALNVVCITFSLFVVMLWWLRRQEAAAGLFGLFVAVGGLRNCRYFVEGDLHFSANFDSWLYFVAHAVATCLQSWFIMALTGTRWRWLHLTLCAVLVGFPLFALAAMSWDPGLTQTRNLLQGALLMLLPPSMWMIVRSGTSIPRNLLLGMGIGWFIALLASFHDFLFGRLVGDVSFSFWLPWAIPMMMPQFAVMVVKRIVSAFNEIEQVNQRLETKVAERTQELAAANAAKSHFLAAASHDLRQPVAAIGLLTDLLQSKLTDPALRGLTDRLARAVHSMESLLKGLLDLSRLDAGTVDTQPRRVPLQPLLDAVMSHEMDAAVRKGLRLRVRATAAAVYTDPLLMEQIIRNLVGNAIRYTATGGVLVGVRRRGRNWVLQVWDSGPGIEPVDQQRIFEAFVQLANPARNRTEGLGLGLAIVHRAAGLLGHTVTVRSVPSRGSVFSVTMPAAPPAASSPWARLTASPTAAAPMSRSPHAVPEAHADHGNDVAHLAGHPVAADHSAAARLPLGRVLIVEDDQALRDTLVSVMRSWGVEEVACGDSLAWVTAQPARHWDLVLSDNRLGDGTGRKVIQHLRTHQPNLPALILTGDTSPEQLAELANSGVPVLHKPFRGETLRAMVLDTMARKLSDDSV
jgi:signal transduction histidine kinase